MSINLPADLGIRISSTVFKHGDSAIEHRARPSGALPISLIGPIQATFPQARNLRLLGNDEA
jgi:hypothetical protein